MKAFLPYAVAVAAGLSAALATAMVVGVGGCSQTTIAELQEALTAAEDLGAAYASLPACAAGAPPLCSDPAVVAKIKSADATAFKDLTLLELNTSGTVTPATVQADIAALSALIPTTK